MPRLANAFTGTIDRLKGKVASGKPLTENQRLGRLGEDAAVRYLQKNGYRILNRNFLCKGGEIDIIAEDCATVAFVEVKARSPRSHFAPAEAVDENKQARVRLAAQVFLSSFPETGPVRYDIVSVFLGDAGAVERVELLKDAFR